MNDYRTITCPRCNCTCLTSDAAYVCGCVGIEIPPVPPVDLSGLFSVKSGVVYRADGYSGGCKPFYSTNRKAWLISAVAQRNGKNFGPSRNIRVDGLTAVLPA